MRIQLRLFLENTLKKQPCHMMYRSSSTCTVCTRTALPCTALCHAPEHSPRSMHALSFQHAFSSVYASFHVQSCAMCRSNMQIGYSDAPDIVINFRKSKGHVISDIYCKSTSKQTAVPIDVSQNCTMQHTCQPEIAGTTTYLGIQL